ncbi:hypothetical protein GW17_00043165 [Ensete ventricosum]|nr:hypothetical protein GW17_00043165 [Ensete ventricosum]
MCTTGTSGTYRSERIPTYEPPSIRQYQCFDLISGDTKSVLGDNSRNLMLPRRTNQYASDFVRYRGVLIGTSRILTITKAYRLFLLGLEKYGKGDWRSISRNFVISRTPTQVASHAQKYFIRLNSMNKDRRRTSIHDITTVTNGDTPTPQGPITGQINAPAATAGKSAKHSLQSSADQAGVGIFGTTIGQPVVGGPLMPAVGTPVNLPVPAGSHIGYPVRTPVKGRKVGKGVLECAVCLSEFENDEELHRLPLYSKASTLVLRYSASTSTRCKAFASPPDFSMVAFRVSSIESLSATISAASAATSSSDDSVDASGSLCCHLKLLQPCQFLEKSPAKVSQAPKLPSFL